LENFNSKRAAHTMKGMPPQAASDQAMSELDDPDALWIKNSPGVLRLTGRTIGEGITSTAPIGVPA